MLLAFPLRIPPHLIRRVLTLSALAFFVSCSQHGTLGSGTKSSSSEAAAVAPPDESSAMETAAPLITNSIGMKLALIPAGEFDMGSDDSPTSASSEGGDANEDERPRHRVRITKPFYMGIYEVTQGEVERVLGVRESFYRPDGFGAFKLEGIDDTSRYPAEQVTWSRAVEFCKRLSELPEEKEAGRFYRLPTEAEWEYACRAGTTTEFHLGDGLSSTQANFNGHYPHGGAPKGPFLSRTVEVGSFAPNAFGLFDMHGNVWEWCLDWFGSDYYQHSPSVDPRGPETGQMRVIRGGGWYSDARDCRSAFRYADTPEGIFYVDGFRVVMTDVHGRLDPFPATAPPDAVTSGGKGEASPPSASGDAAALAAALTTAASGEEWPRWRGPRGDGTWHGPRLAETWQASGLTRIWSQSLGPGYAGIAVAHGRVFTMDYAAKPDERERVICLSATTGKPLWSHTYPVAYGDLAYGSGPRVTPAVAGRRVFTLGAMGDLACLDATTGEPRWTRHFVRDFNAAVPIWGFSASPIAYENLLIVHPGAAPDGSLVALDQISGEEVWRSLGDPAGYSTPIVAEVAGADQLIAWTPSHVRGLDPQTGDLRWSVAFSVRDGTSITTPIFRDNIVLVSGYWEGSRAVELVGSPAKARLLWKDSRNLRSLMAQPLFRDGYAYLLDKRNGLTCFELRTGERRWTDGNRLTPKGRNPQATMIWTGHGDRAVALNSEGDLVLLGLNPKEYTELARANIIEPTSAAHTIWAHPAYSRGRVYARSDSEIVCVALPVSQSEEP